MKLLLISLLSISAVIFAQEFNKEYADDPVVLMKTTKGDIYIELFAKEAPKTVKNFLDLAEGRKEFTETKTQKKATRNYYDGLIFHRVIPKFMIQGGCPIGVGTGGPGYKFEDEISAKSLGLHKLKAFQGGRPHQNLGIRSQQQFYQVVLMPLLKKLGISSQEELQKRSAEVQKAVEALTVQDCFENQGYSYNDTLKSHQPSRGVLAMANSGPNTNGSQFFINVIDTPWLAGKHTVFGKVLKGMDVVDAISNVKTSPANKPREAIKIISIREVK
ncbi:peptidylprolyl isomerase [Candidatus Uabimicrobium amorphum]|uniref:Peptidyl-prolyl cis-trans isomerase n=1 Tax=Uabimicrobium amorphum TaxID=2596890 RepID=A0A5S9IMT2_UABAM|nr:peptidylprolyl isomerase [Candidatus Uabimicrobium amorphum]BBM83445.1 peptidyl-prolyl cis-trans isomerase [Candidatus Uabimicrobium amorphum]